jgi:hypothetical protein
VNHLLLPRHKFKKARSTSEKNWSKKTDIFQVYKSQRMHFSKDVPKSQREAKENLRKVEQDAAMKK